MMNGAMMDMNGFMGWGGMFAGPLVIAVVTGLVVVLAVVLLRGRTGSGQGKQG